MSETKWTPGPLLSDAEGLVFKDDALGTQVANCRDAIYIPPAERAANARLYSAAPDLYAVLKPMVAFVEAYRVSGSEKNYTALYPFVTAARAALAKAESK